LLRTVVGSLVAEHDVECMVGLEKECEVYIHVWHV
jgi:hypothetical protein